MDDLSSGSRLQVEDGVPPVPKNQENKHLKSNQFQVQKQKLLYKRFSHSCEPIPQQLTRSHCISIENVFVLKENCV